MNERNEFQALWIAILAFLLICAFYYAYSQTNIVSQMIDRAVLGSEAFNRQQVCQLQGVPNNRSKGFEIVQMLQQLSVGKVDYDIWVEGHLYIKDFPLHKLDLLSILSTREYNPIIIRDGTGIIKEVQYQ